MDKENKLHIRDMVGEIGSNVADSDGVYFFIADKISDTGFIMKTALNLMNKDGNAFYFFEKYKDIWHKTMEDIFNRSNAGYGSLKSCDSMDDAAENAAGFLNSGRDVYLLCDSRKLVSIADDKIKKHEMHVSFRIGSLIDIKLNSELLS